MRDRRQRLLHVTRLEGDLGVGEAEGSKAGRGMGLVAQPVSRLLSSRSVVAQAVRLHHQPELGPVEVDPEAIDAARRLRRRKSRPARERQKASLELGVRERERSPVEGLPEYGRAGCSSGPDESRTQRLGVSEVEPVCFVDHLLETIARQTRGQVDQGADERRDRDALPPRELFGAEARRR